MVIKLDQLSPYLWEKIAEQMEFDDFKNFNESSKLGRLCGFLAKTTIEVEALEILVNDVKIHIGGKNKILWSEAKKKENCPRFITRKVCCTPHDKITIERCWEIFKEVENGHFLGRNAHLTQVYLPNPEESATDTRNGFIIDTDCLNQFIQVFDVTELTCLLIDSPYKTLEPIHKMKSVYLKSPINDGDLLALEAKDIYAKSNSWNIHAVLNKFLEQWHLNQRTIQNLKLKCLSIDRWTNDDLENETFAGLPYVHLWSWFIHDNTRLSELNVKDLMEIQGKSFYSVHSQGKTLFVTFYDNYVTAKEVTDEYEALLNELTHINFRKLTGRCKLCNMSECSDHFTYHYRY